MELEWKAEELYGEVCYRASFPWNEPFVHDEYIIYKWINGWAYSRPDHSILGKFSGCVTRLDIAKLRCETDLLGQARLRGWHEYMLANDSPDYPIQGD